jgi:peptidoglycan/LPS O-acetylase OafA/YrhL
MQYQVSPAMRDDSSVAPPPALKDHPSYRPDIDGLRAVAVLSVVGFHAAPGRFPGGFIGVDIFFVISGFLISTIIMNGLNRDRFSFVEFYVRRIKRIFPALLAVLLTCFVVGGLLLVDDDFRALGKHIASGAFFVSNITLWLESGYFDSSADFKPLLHLWSLGIEEQFYILWPLLLWFFAKRAGGFLWLTIVVGVISFAANIVLISGHPVATFYSPLTRFWELLVGCGLALLIERPLFLQSYQRNIASLAGAALLGICFALVDRNRAFPGWWALMPTFGAAMLIWAGPGAWLNRFVLSNRVLVFFGLISFPLYLWHWPLLAFPRILEGTETPQSWRLVAVAAAIMLAWMTYELIEKPIRRSRAGQSVPAALALAMGATGLAAAVALAPGSLTWRPFPPVVLNAGDIGHGPFLTFIEKNFFPCTPIEIRNASDSWNGIVRCFQSKETLTKDIALVGDSHAESLFPGMAERFVERNVVFYGGDGLPFIDNPDYAQIYAFVASDRNITEVLIAAVWERKLRQLSVPEWRQGLTKTVSYLTHAGKHVYLVDDVPTFSFRPNICKYAGRLGIKNKCSEKDESFVPVYAPVFRDIAAKDTAVHVLSVHESFCPAGVCSMANDGSLLFRDEHHLTLAGSIKAASVIGSQMPYQ